MSDTITGSAFSNGIFPLSESVRQKDENIFKQSSKHKWEEALKADGDLDGYGEYKRPVKEVADQPYHHQGGGNTEGALEEIRLSQTSDVNTFPLTSTKSGFFPVPEHSIKQVNRLYAGAAASGGVNMKVNESGVKAAGTDSLQKINNTYTAKPFQDMNVRLTVIDDVLHVHIRDFNKRYVKELDSYLRDIMEGFRESNVKLDKVFFNAQKLDLSKNIIKQLEVL